MDDPDAPAERLRPGVLAAVALLAVAIFALDTLLPLGVAGGVPYVLVVLIAIAADGRRLVLFAAAVSTILVALGYVTSADAVDLRDATWVPVLNRGLAVFAVWAIAALGLLRERAEAAHTRAKARLAELDQLLEMIPEPLALIDEQGRIARVNRQLRLLFGYEDGALLGRPVDALVPENHRERDLPRLRRYLASANPRRAGLSLEIHAIRHDGVEFPAEVTLSPIETDRGIALSLSIRDTTDRVALENQLRQAQKMEAVGQLTGGIAHDFNNILTVIAANAEFLRAALPADAPDLHEEMGDLLAAVTRGTAMIKKLLSFSRREALQFKAVSVPHLAHETVEMLTSVLPESIEVELHLTPGLPPIHGDPGAVQQILLNLGTNARDAMPDGGRLRVELTATELDEGYHATHPWVIPGRYVRIAASDNGVGMDAATRERVFEPFFTTKPAGAGTGLGLAMVYGLMKQHLGFVNVYSEPGRGTTVSLYFPVDHVSAETERPEWAPAAPPRGTETVLVVEDEVNIRRAVKRALESYGYTVLLAQDGEEALEVYRLHRDAIALIVSDMVMPRLGGRQLYEALKGAGADVKFLFTSAYLERDIYEASGLGGIPFIQKPWTVTDLMRRVREVLDAPQPDLPA